MISLTRVADTSFLYAAFDAADARHKEARDEIAKAQALNIPLCVMAEFLDLVTYRHDHRTARQVQLDLMKLATVALVPLRDERGVLSIWAAHPDLSMVDAVGIKACIEAQATLLSYDSKQTKALAAHRRKEG